MAKRAQQGELDQRVVDALVRLAEADFSVRLPRTFDRSAHDALAYLVNTIAEELDATWRSHEQAHNEQEAILRVVSDGLMAMASGQFDQKLERSGDGSTRDVLAFLLNNTAQELGTLVAARETKAAEVAALRSSRSADRLSAMATLAAGAAHELATPLSSATLLVQEVLDVLDTPQVAEAGPLLTGALEALHRSSELLDDLRVFSREPPRQTSLVNLERVILSAARLLKHEAANRCELLVKTVPAVVKANEARLAQVFVNLLQNAMQAIEPGQKSAHAVTLTMRLDGKSVSTSIRDTGGGMNEEVLARAFEPFFTTKTELFGTGLGLSVSQATVEEFGGEIDISSQEGIGTLVVVALPIAEGAPAPEQPAQPARPCSLRETRIRHTVVVVDDDPLLLRALNRVLSRDYEVLVARSGNAALSLLSDIATPAAVLCDVMMPEMTGPQLYDVIRCRKPHLARRFLFLSGGAVTDATRAFLAGVPHILKPVDQTALLTSVGAHIRSLEPAR